MNGYTPSTPVRKQIANLTEQIPAIHRTNVLAIAITDSGNEYDFCSRLTGLVLGKVWTSFGEHAICEADDLEVVENTKHPLYAKEYDNVIEFGRFGKSRFYKKTARRIRMVNAASILRLGSGGLRVSRDWATR